MRAEVIAEFEAKAAEVARALLEDTQDDILKRFGKYRTDPIGFCKHELGFIPWESDVEGLAGQADLIRAVLTHTRIACKSGHKIGKSITAVALSLWFVATRTGARVLLTAPAYHQIKNILWKEMRDIFRRQSLAKKLGADVALDPATGLKLPNGNEVIAISTNTKENLAGISGAEMLFIVDEASGFPDDLWEVLSSGNAAGGVILFVISNPTRTSGWFYDLFRRKLSGWALFTISSETTPNVRAGKKLIPGLATAEFISEMREKCGGYALDENGTPAYAKDATYQVRIVGQFPSQGSDSVVPAALLEKATRAWKPQPPKLDEDLVLGVDVGRYGDDPSVIQPVRGLYAYAPDHITGADGNAVADKVMQVFHRVRLGSERVRVNVDGIGVGASVVDALKRTEEAKRGLLVICDVNVGESADEDVARELDEDKPTKTHYSNLRSQVWFGVTEWLKTGGVLPDHEELGRELLAATYSFDLKNRKKVVEKKVMREVLGRSPDFADALCLAVYTGAKGVWFDMNDRNVVAAVFGVSVNVANNSPNPLASTKAADYYSDEDDRRSGGGHGRYF